MTRARALVAATRRAILWEALLPTTRRSLSSQPRLPARWRSSCSRPTSGAACVAPVLGMLLVVLLAAALCCASVGDPCACPCRHHVMAAGRKPRSQCVTCARCASTCPAFVCREYTKEAEEFFEAPGPSANAGKAAASDSGDMEEDDAAESSADEKPVLGMGRRRLRAR